jgi:hypothetical protein
LPQGESAVSASKPAHPRDYSTKSCAYLKSVVPFA